MTQNESSSPIQVHRHQSTPAAANCSLREHSQSARFCIETILRDAAGGEPELGRRAAEPAYLGAASHAQLRQHHQALGDYYAHYYAQQRHLGAPAQASAGSKLQAAVVEQQQAAAAAAAAALAANSAAAVRHLQSFVMQHQQRQHAPSQASSALGQALLAAGQDRGGSPTGSAGVSAHPAYGAQYGQYGGQASAPLEWLAKAGLLYGHQQPADASSGAHQIMAAAAAAAAAAARQSHFEGVAGDQLAGSPHDPLDQQHPGEPLSECGQAKQALGGGGVGQRQSVSPGFVQPIRHHVVMSPNTIASAAFAGKCSRPLPAGVVCARARRKCVPRIVIDSSELRDLELREDD